MSPREDDSFGKWENRLEKQGWTSSGGQITLGPELPPGNELAPISYVFLSDWESLQPRSVEWQVNVQLRAPFVPAGFPPSALAATFTAGAHFPPDLWDGDGFTCVVAKHELGSGPNARTIFTDLRPGRFALGVQTRVRTSLARWFRADPGGGQYDVQSSVAHADTSDADPPTFSATRVIAPGALVGILQPPGALWVDLTISGGPTTVEITTFDFNARKSNVPAALVCYPPSSPWPAPLSGAFDVQNVGPNAARVTMQWWVR